MRSCENAHRAFDGAVGGKVTVGKLPDWTRVTGKVAYAVMRGPYSGLPEAWATFMPLVMSARFGAPIGPSGEVFVCPPTEHEADGGREMLTVLYVPVR